MILRFGLFFALLLTWSCSGDEAAQQPPKEPVAAEQKIPDNPGDSGEAKPAADAQAAAPAAAPEPEKSTPPPPPPPPPAAASAGEMTVKAGALNVRNGAGTKHAVVRTLKRGEKVTPASCAKGWCKLGEGEFVSEKYLTHAP